LSGVQCLVRERSARELQWSTAVTCLAARRDLVVSRETVVCLVRERWRDASLTLSLSLSLVFSLRDTVVS